jgi:hypothetical protein
VAANPDQPEIRYAESEQDMTAIHQFLLVVAAPAMQCPVNPLKSLEEIIRVVRSEVALMLVRDGRLVGTMGIVNPVWWYGDATFLTDRWHFVLPEIMNTPAADMLEDEAIKIAEAAGIKFVHQGKIRKGKKGVLRLMPRVYGGDSATVPDKEK